jgi:hypothetical protein
MVTQFSGQTIAPTVDFVSKNCQPKAQESRKDKEDNGKIHGMTFMLQ